MSDSNEHPRSAFSRLRDVLFPWRRQPPITRRERDVDRETLRVQVDVIRRAFDEKIGGSDTEAPDFLHHRGRVLVDRDGANQLRRFFEGRQDEYDGTGGSEIDNPEDAADGLKEPVDDLFLFPLPPRRSDGEIDVLRTLSQVDDELGEGVATPDHILYVAGSLGKACPATEPVPPASQEPIPALNQNPAAGQGVRVSVVDTGWYPDAATDSDTTWLAKGVEGDVEHVNPNSIHEYAGHGTFVAGVVRCMAPGTDIEVEGFLTKGGAIYESEIAEQLHEAMVDWERDEEGRGLRLPDLISISAGSHTWQNQPLKGFEALARLHKLIDGDDAVLIVAAAGNDGNDVPFWPAAFDWVVSVGAVDRDGRVPKFSNVGPWVDVYAHGCDLVNAFPTGKYKYYEPASPQYGQTESFTGLAQWSGTSFATPIVTGAIAALMSERPISARKALAELVAAAPTQQDPRAGLISTLGPPFM